MVGPHRVARAALPSMRARGKGLILNISSELARFTMPFLGSYCGTKAALESMSESYAYELKPLGVEVTLVQPGAYPTDFAKNAVMGAVTEGLNKAHAEAEKAVMGAMGMGNLV